MSLARPEPAINEATHGTGAIPIDLHHESAPPGGSLEVRIGPLVEVRRKALAACRRADGRQQLRQWTGLAFDRSFGRLAGQSRIEEELVGHLHRLTHMLRVAFCYLANKPERRGHA